MKKAFLLTGLAMLLCAGCTSGTSDAGKSTTCSMDIEGTGTLTISVNGDNENTVTGFGMNIVVDKELLGGVDLSGLDDDTKQMLEDTLIQAIGIDPDAQGIEVSADFGETITVDVNIDLASVDTDALSALGMDSVDWSSVTYDDFVDQLNSDSTMTCQ